MNDEEREGFKMSLLIIYVGLFYHKEYHSTLHTLEQVAQLLKHALAPIEGLKILTLRNKGNTTVFSSGAKKYNELALVVPYCPILSLKLE